MPLREPEDDWTYWRRCLWFGLISLLGTLILVAGTFLAQRLIEHFLRR